MYGSQKTIWTKAQGSRTTKQAAQPNPLPRVRPSQHRDRNFSYANIVKQGFSNYIKENQLKNQGNTDAKSVLEQKMMQRMEHLMKTMFNLLKEMIMAIFSSQINMRQYP